MPEPPALYSAALREPLAPRTEAFPGYRWSEFPQLWKESVDNDATAC